MRQQNVMPDLTAGSCSGMDTEFMFMTDEKGRVDSDTVMALRRMCAGCAVFTACFEWSVFNEKHGWWAGMNASERNALRLRGFRSVSAGRALEHLRLMGAPLEVAS